MKRYYIKLKKGETQTLLKALQKHLKLSEKECKTLISQGSVWNADKKERIKEYNYQITEQLILINYPIYKITPYELKEDLIYFEDKYLLVIYKEPGISIHPTPYADIDSLSYAVQNYLIKKGIKYKVSAINRLDKPTSGLVFFAKSKEAEKRLHKMFREKKIKKVYCAKTLPFDSVKTHYIISDTLEWNGKKKNAKTYIKFLGEENGFFNFLVFLKTGRTHQIRKHFAKYLIPIYGDAQYGNFKSTQKMELTCFYYKFTHPFTNKQIVVRSK